MNRERASYVERTRWPAFAVVLLWGAVVLSCYPILAGWDTDLPVPVRWGIVGLILTGTVLVHVFLGGLTARVQETRLFIHLGWLPLIHRVVPFEDILEIESVVYSPLREFGGWGLRGVGKKKAWTVRGSQAVRLSLTGDRMLYVGSEQPSRLEQRIRSAMGVALGRESREENW